MPSVPTAAEALYPDGPDDKLGNQALAPPQDNFNTASAEMNLNPEEKALYQRHLKNLYGSGGVDNPDGSRSTLFQATMEHNGKFYAVPTVFDGKILQGKDLTARIRREGIERFPSYDSEDEAEERYQKMHSYMEKDTATYLKGRQ
jgi:hypothetical protein